jgi:hypothetical protein
MEDDRCRALRSFHRFKLTVSLCCDLSSPELWRISTYLCGGARLLLFGAITSPPSWQPKIKALLVRCEELVEMRQQEKSRIDPSPLPESAAFIKRHIKVLDRHKAIAQHLAQLLKEHAGLGINFDD